MPYPVTSINDAVNQIMASPAPILFPDTCALVDLIRVPYRAKNLSIAKNTLEAANHLVSCSKTVPPRLWIVIPPPIQDEWNEQSQRTINTLQQHWIDLGKKIEIAHAAANAVNVALPPAIIYTNQNIENALLSLSLDFLTNAIFLDNDPDSVLRAYAREVKKEAPARKGGSMKDCTIIEHCLELCTQLRNAGFVEKCTFNTSNTTDFCRTGSTKELDVPLDAQFNSVNLSLTTYWQWAKAELGI